MSMNEWAKREIEIACERERAVSTEEGEWDYGVACYESAYKAFESLCEDGHSGFSIGLIRNILNRLIDGKPLTPIEDTEDAWEECDGLGRDHECKAYQCKRMSSLFKDVYADGTVRYSDVNRIICVDTDNPNNSWHNGFVSGLVDEMLPITMPYIPANKPYKVYVRDLLADPKNGDYDTRAVLYMVTPEGERIDIHRYFAEDNGSDTGWREIDFTEYDKRFDMDLYRREEAIKNAENK